jgi:hypothetical protein
MADSDLHMTMPMRTLAQHVTMHVTMTGVRRYALRLWLSVQLMKLAAWVAGVGITVDTETAP